MIVRTIIARYVAKKGTIPAILGILGFVASLTKSKKDDKVVAKIKKSSAASDVYKRQDKGQVFKRNS